MSEVVETPARLLLASASWGRKKVLTDAGLAFDTQVSNVDEDAVLQSAVDELGPRTPAQTALLLAKAKAEDVAAADHREGTLVLGCDSVFELDGVAYGKPHTPEVARERWQQLSGSTGVLHSGHWLIDTLNPEAAQGRISSTVVHFSKVSEAEIEAYVASGEPLPCAGAFTIDGLAASFIESIEGNFQNVVGLDVSTLRALLGQAGVQIIDLWK
ncbi:septum formation inhibitor Maf [Arthrobacter sp. YC-RL1]|uniref:Maf family protein n=1 Tax=Arthrobacter sp. YC-RL1 TaxID=1652545 RepID=UPI00063DB91F|nr:nucleoside triphosphate pyrophosphatase [Arthrobacter sp. YC-RL1]ALQ31538.1 septum formation inhibitor Maf [Arthrobacter sp. YC-RL1]KLI89984.1 septum formation inhibitor Maf [Arthrobacter sp. YC-RL1]